MEIEDNRNKIKKTKKNLKRKQTTRRSNQYGSSYKGALRSMNLNSPEYTVRYICAHGEISPEIFYVVPKNVYILLPNVCGVATSVTHTIADPIYQNKENSQNIFKKKFITGETANVGTQFTVFIPGDIIPMQTFIFSPHVGHKSNDSVKIGFVGVFTEAALFNNILYKEIESTRIYDNIFKLNIDTTKKLAFSLLNYFRTNFIKDFKDKKPYGNLWGLYRDLTRKFYDTKNSITTSDLLTYNAEAFIPYDLIKKIPINSMRTLLTYLLPLIPENLISPILIDKYFETIRTPGASIPNISLKTVIDTTKNIDQPTYFVVNACRSLMEKKFGDFNSTVEKRYNMPNITKYSAEMIHNLDRLTLNIDGDIRTGFNMNNINAIREAAGLPKIRQDVFHYSELLNILRETENTDVILPNSPYFIIKNRLSEAILYLSSYKPVEEVKATRNIKSEIYTSVAAAEAAKTAEIEEILSSKRKELEKNIESTKKTISKLKLDVKYNKSKKLDLDEKQALLKKLKQLLDDNST